MKFILLVLLNFSLHAFSQTENPVEFCNDTKACTEKMLQISKDYAAGNSDFAKEDLIGFSGACYHLASIYNPDHRHHGAFLFERHERDYLATGIFSFFAEEDPFKSLSAPELKDWLLQNQSRFAKTIETETQVELQYLEPKFNLHYWFRSHNENTKLSLIAKQAFGAADTFYIFCEMARR